MEAKLHFTQMIKNKNVNKSENIDWDSKRVFFENKVNELYEKIEIFLKDVKEENSILTEYETIEIIEEKLGLYKIKRLIIKVANEYIVFTPIGTILIGAKGRIDIESSLGRRAKLILTDEAITHIPSPRDIKLSEHDIWKYASNPPKIILTNFNEESFFTNLTEVLGG